MNFFKKDFASRARLIYTNAYDARVVSFFKPHTVPQVYVGDGDSLETLCIGSTDMMNAGDGANYLNISGLLGSGENAIRPSSLRNDIYHALFD